MQPRIAIIGSCVTRDIWLIEGLAPPAGENVLYLARTSFASLFAQPVAGYESPEQIPPELSRWELRMVADDVLKRGIAKIAEHRPTHIVLDLIDERFDLLASGASVVTHSYELHLTGFETGPLAGYRRIPRISDEAGALWRAGVDAFAAFLGERFPEARIIFHDARWATTYQDASGARQTFEPDRSIWGGEPANLHAHNALLAEYGAYLRRVFPKAFLVRMPDALTVGDETHRWGLSPFHYIQPYYRELWRRLAMLGCEGR